MNDLVIYKNRKISVLEIPYPKYWSPYKEWLEHVKFVIDTGFQEFMKKYENISFDIKSLQKKINPDIGIEHQWVRIKFHQNSLEYVVKYLE